MKTKANAQRRTPNPVKKTGQAAQSRTKRAPLNAGKLERFLHSHVRQKERGKALYKSSDVALDHILALGPAIDAPVAVQFRSGKNIITRKLVVKDLFATTNTVFKSASAHRFAVEDYKEPKPEKAIRDSGSKVRDKEKETATP